LAYADSAVNTQFTDISIKHCLLVTSLKGHWSEMWQVLTQPQP